MTSGAARRRSGAWRAIAVAALLATGCTVGSGPRRKPPPEPALRIWAPPVVHWAPGSDRALRFAIENGTSRTMQIREPDPAHASIAIFRGPEAMRACGIEPAKELAAAAAQAPADPPGAAETVALGPGDAVDLRVDLGEACRELPPGEYRYEVSYAPQGGAAAPRTSYGMIVVEGGRALGRGAPAPRRRSP